MAGKSLKNKMRKTRILITCVNYNTTDKLKKYIESISESFAKSESSMQLTVLVGDNSEEPTIIDSLPNVDYDFIHYDNKGNLGF